MEDDFSLKDFSCMWNSKTVNDKTNNNYKEEIWVWIKSDMIHYEMT